MAELDQFIMARVSPELRAGEQIMGIGWVRQARRINVLGVPQEYHDYLAAATNQRLVLLRTEPASTMSLLVEKVKPLCNGVVVWEYPEIARIDLGQVAGLSAGARFFSIAPHGPLGPHEGQGRRYDIYPKVRDLDGQSQFFTQFPDWLQQQVASGAFPMDAATQQKLVAHQQRQAAEAQAERERQEARRQKMQAFFGKVKSLLGGAADATGNVKLSAAGMLMIGAIVATLVTLGAVAKTYYEFDMLSFYEKMRADAIKYSKKDIYDETEKRRYLEQAKEDEESIAEHQVGAIVWSVVTILSFVGTGVLFVLAIKKRKGASAGPSPMLSPAGAEHGAGGAQAGGPAAWQPMSDAQGAQPVMTPPAGGPPGMPNGPYPGQGPTTPYAGPPYPGANGPGAAG